MAGVLKICRSGGAVPTVLGYIHGLREGRESAFRYGDTRVLGGRYIFLPDVLFFWLAFYWFPCALVYHEIQQC